MTTALALNTNRLRRTSNLLTEPALRKMVSLPVDLAEDIASLKSRGRERPIVLDAEFDSGTVGDFEYLEVANEWARRFYEAWIKALSLEEFLALDEYKREGFRSLNRGLREYDGDLSMLPPEDRRRAEGLDAALEKAPPLEGPVVVYRGRLPDAVLEAFETGEEETLLDQVFGDPAYTSTSLASGIAREYGGSSRFPDSVGKITLPRGTKSGYVDAVFDKGQSELLLPRETRFRIDRAYRKDGVYCIEGELVPW